MAGEALQTLSPADAGGARAKPYGSVILIQVKWLYGAIVDPITSMLDLRNELS